MLTGHVLDSREEILAICSEATESIGDSPDLGPPPVSRFVDEDPVKIDLPMRSPSENGESSTLAESATIPAARTKSATRRLEEAFATGESTEVKPEQSTKKEPSAPSIEQKPESNFISRTEPLAGESSSPANTQAAKPNLKRKSRDEEEHNSIVVRAGNPPAPIRMPATITATTTTTQPEKPAVFKDRTTNRPIKELSSIKKDGRVKTKSANSTTVTSGTQGRPLGTKSSNENLNSPKKVAAGKPNAQANVDEVAKAKADMRREEHAKSRAEARKAREKARAVTSAPVLEIPTPLEPVIPEQAHSIEIDSPVDMASQDLQPPEPEPEPEPDSNHQQHEARETPHSPEPRRSPSSSSSAAMQQQQGEEIRDTPPPVDISARGETTMGSRRTRTRGAAVSYAEPNLRDKMRRPTKQLLDAVSGEGKSHMRRASQSRVSSADSLNPTPGSALSAAAPPSAPSAKSTSEKYVREARAVEDAARARELHMPNSPLAQKTSSRTSASSAPSPHNGGDDRARDEASTLLPTTVVTDRNRKRSSSTAGPEPSTRRLDEVAKREAEVARMFDGPDDTIEMQMNPPPPQQQEEHQEDPPVKNSSSRTGRASRRLSSITREEDLADAASEAARHEKKTAGASARVSGRKRASMMALGGGGAGRSSRVVADPDPDTSSSVDGDSGLAAAAAVADTAGDSAMSGAGAAARERASARRRSMML